MIDTCDLTGEKNPTKCKDFIYEPGTDEAEKDVEES